MKVQDFVAHNYMRTSFGCYTFAHCSTPCKEDTKLIAVGDVAACHGCRLAIIDFRLLRHIDQATSTILVAIPELCLISSV